MNRSSFLAFAVVIGLSISAGVADAQQQQQQRRRTGFVNNNTFAPTRFSYQSMPITRFHAHPIYPQTIFLAPGYSNQGPYNGREIGTIILPPVYTPPEYYPGTPFRFGQPQDFDAVIR
jgi:hypothetical protein